MLEPLSHSYSPRLFSFCTYTPTHKEKLKANTEHLLYPRSIFVVFETRSYLEALSSLELTMKTRLA